jgi:hypothetical protein
LVAKTSSLDEERNQMQNVYVDKRIEFDAEMFKNILEIGVTTITDPGEEKMKLRIPTRKSPAGVSGDWKINEKTSS